MPVHVIWKNEEKTIIAHVYEGTWDVPEFLTAVQTTNAFLDSIDHPATLFLDVRHSRMIPSGFMPALRSSYRAAHPNIVLIVMVGINTLAQSFLTLFGKIDTMELNKVPVYFARDEADASTIIQSWKSHNQSSEVS